MKTIIRIIEKDIYLSVFSNGYGSYTFSNYCDKTDKCFRWEVNIKEIMTEGSLGYHFNKFMESCVDFGLLDSERMEHGGNRCI